MLTIETLQGFKLSIVKIWANLQTGQRSTHELLWAYVQPDLRIYRSDIWALSLICRHGARKFLPMIKFNQHHIGVFDTSYPGAIFKFIILVFNWLLARLTARVDSFLKILCMYCTLMSAAWTSIIRKTKYDDVVPYPINTKKKKKKKNRRKNIRLFIHLFILVYFFIYWSFIHW